MLLTGTPLQNTVEELFSLLHFLEPSRFPSETTFMQEFGDLKTEEQVLNPPLRLLGILRCKDYATVFATMANSFVYPPLGLQVIITKVVSFVPQPPQKAC